MTRRDEIGLYIKELQDTVSIAALHYEIWWIYNGPDTKAKYVKPMQRYGRFFSASNYAHFVTLVITLYRLYEKKSDTFNIPTLLRMLDEGGNIPLDTAKELRTTENSVKPLWKKVGVLRNRVFGHRSKAHTVEQLFKDAGITPNDLTDIIELTKTLLNKLTCAWNGSAHLFNTGAQDAVIHLFDDLTTLQKSNR